MKKSGTKFEFSAGGIAIDGQKILMVKVENLEGSIVWTFPKGHIEPGEKVEEAALREVQEETGYRCEITKPFDRIQYYFRQNGMLIKKTVTWFLMKALEKTGVHDPDEIMETQWFSVDDAEKTVRYKSDKKIIATLKKNDSFTLMTFEPVIGLEVHIQLKTASKLFCRCSTTFGAEPNSQVCPICTGQPGTLPVMNKKAVELLARAALGLGCTITPNSIFSRKQYFYPDLPKAYQISQFDKPVATGGQILIEDGKGGKKTIRITRIHLEEDAGKLLHAIGNRELSYSLVDLNRAGIPLAECVSEPDLSSPEEAYAYLTQLKTLLQYLDVSDCDMEKGSLRCDANISLRPIGHTKLGTRAEIKNLNSFKAVKESLHYEIKRQMEVLNTEGRVVQETRLWNDELGLTKPMRSKEQAHDYRYFPEPDLVPLNLSNDYIHDLRQQLPELPDQKKERLITRYKLTDYDAGVLIGDKALAHYFESAVEQASPDIAKPICNWMTTELLGRLNASSKTIESSPISPQHLAKLVLLVQKGTISGKTAKDVFSEMFETQQDPEQIVKAKGLLQIGDESTILKWCEEAIAEMPKAVAEYKGGKERAIGSIMGLVMKKSKGTANAQVVNQLLQKKLAS